MPKRFPVFYYTVRNSQSNIADRWKEHVKCGLGIDTPANKLYAAMQKYGVENFTFELLEDCPRAQLNEREKYYIDLYKT